MHQELKAVTTEMNIYDVFTTFLADNPTAAENLVPEATVKNILNIIYATAASLRHNCLPIEIFKHPNNHPKLGINAFIDLFYVT